MARLLTVPEVAKQFGCRAWKVRRLYERGILCNPPRAGQTRLIAERDLPRIRKALIDAGYLALQQEAQHVG